MGYTTSLFLRQALSASTSSPACSVADASNYSVQAQFTGATCSFTAVLQISDDLINPINWNDLADSSQIVTVAGSFLWNVSQAGYRWVRLSVTDNSSGTNTGTISANVNVKGPL